MINSLHARNSIYVKKNATTKPAPKAKPRMYVQEAGTEAAQTRFTRGRIGAELLTWSWNREQNQIKFLGHQLKPIPAQFAKK